MAAPDPAAAGALVGPLVGAGTFVLAVLGYFANDAGKRREEDRLRIAAAESAKAALVAERNELVDRLGSENKRLSDQNDALESESERLRSKARHWEDRYDVLWGTMRRMQHWMAEAYPLLKTQDPTYETPPTLPDKPRDFPGENP